MSYLNTPKQTGEKQKRPKNVKAEIGVETLSSFCTPFLFIQ